MEYDATAAGVQRFQTQAGEEAILHVHMPWAKAPEVQGSYLPEVSQQPLWVTFLSGPLFTKEVAGQWHQRRLYGCAMHTLHGVVRGCRVLRVLQPNGAGHLSSSTVHSVPPVWLVVLPQF